MNVFQKFCAESLNEFLYLKESVKTFLEAFLLKTRDIISEGIYVGILERKSSDLFFKTSLKESLKDLFVESLKNRLRNSWKNSKENHRGKLCQKT